MINEVHVKRKLIAAIVIAIILIAIMPSFFYLVIMELRTKFITSLLSL